MVERDAGGQVIFYLPLFDKTRFTRPYYDMGLVVAWIRVASTTTLWAG
jgi:hypothetical protein